MLKCKDIQKKYNKEIFLDNISLEVQKGECFGILGDNGSGKSTLMSIIAGVSPFDSGEIIFDNQRICKKSFMKIGYVAQYPTFMENITVHDNLKLWKSIYHVKTFEYVPTFLGIEEMYHKKVCDLSGGMKKKVSLAIALMNNPEFLILDEAFAALDHQTCENMIEYMKKQNMGVLFSSHNIHEIIKLCDKIMVLKRGKESCLLQENINSSCVNEIYSKF
ncbi:MAG: ABC transporter ATP-binding protein [Eubacteriales bacterium]